MNKESVKKTRKIMAEIFEQEVLHLTRKLRGASPSSRLITMEIIQYLSMRAEQERKWAEEDDDS